MPVLMTRTEDIYLAAGLDAVVMLKTIEYGVQIFTPMAMLSLAICGSPNMHTAVPNGRNACLLLCLSTRLHMPSCMPTSFPTMQNL